jgi:hypothetical protein
VDHLRPYPEGVTCECNTESLCGFHHRIKHETGFRVRWSTNPNHPPGTLIWTGPSGREYIDHPACLDPNMVNRTLPNTNPSITNTTDQTTRPGPGPERQSSNRRPNPPPLPKRDYGPPPF